MLKRTIPLFMLTSLLLITVFAVLPVMANGVPVTVFLNYMPEYSNAGPVEANGEALVSIGEAWVELNAQSMPQLGAGQTYEAWMQELETGALHSAGTFNANVDGTVNYYIELDDLPYTDYSYFFITLEAVPDPDPANPSSQITIAGVFPNPKQVIIATPTPDYMSASVGISGTLEPGSLAQQPGTDGATEGDQMDDGALPPPATLPITGVRLPLFAGFVVVGLSLMVVSLVWYRKR